MRIRKRWVSFLLLTSALPHMADDSSPLLPEEVIAVDYNGEDVEIGQPDQQEQQKRQQQQHNANTNEPIDDNQIDRDDVTATSSPPTASPPQPNKMEPLSRPQQQEQDTGEPRPYDAAYHLASSHDYEDARFENDDEITEDDGGDGGDYRSSLATEDGDDETVAIDASDDHNVGAGDQGEGDNTRTAEGDIAEDCASQAVHEDGFRLPALDKESWDPSTTATEAEIMETDVADGDTSEKEEKPQPIEPSINIEDEESDGQTTQAEDSSIDESETIESIEDNEKVDDDEDDNFEEEEKRQTIEPSVDTENENANDDTFHDQDDHIDIEKTEMTKELELDEVVIKEDNLGTFGSIGTTTTEIELELDEVVVEEDNLGTFGSIGTTELEGEVDDEDVVVLKDAKMAVGTTSIESVVDDDIDSNNIEIIESDDCIDSNNIDIIESDGLVSDTETPEKEDPQQNIIDGSSGSSDEEKNAGTTFENATNEILVDGTDGNTTVDGVNDIAHSDHPDAEVVDAGEVGIIESNTSAGQEMNEEDNRESSDSTEDIDDAAEEDEQKIEDDDDDDDEDLTDRVSVDYASKSAGALIIEKTKDFKGTSNLITGDRDKYAIVPCSEEKKQIVLSLSEGILVKEIKLANYERFASTVKAFQVKGSHTLGEWETLGTFQAKSGNGEQTFVLENPAWARYLKFRFLTHHGAEYYCTLSQIKVHGSNMVQGFHEEWQTIEDEIEENQSEETQSEIDGKPSNSEDSEKDGATKKTEDTVGGLDSDKNSTRISGVREKNDSDSSKEKMEVGSDESGDFIPRDAQDTPSVHPKPKSLDDFRTPANFYQIIQGEMAEEKLFTDLYALIPNAMSNLPAHSKNGMCFAEESELRSVHQIGRVAMESLSMIGSRIAGVIDPSDVSFRTISAPKMGEVSNEYYQKRFGSGISSMINLIADSVIDQPSIETEISDKAITDGEPVGMNGSPTRQTNGTDEGNPDRIAKTTGKTSVSSHKEESSLPAVNDSVEESNDAVDVALLKLLKDLPSAECLVDLDFAEFKKKASTARKSSGAAGGSPGGRMMEPIFKKLTDEIFALQTSLSVHDQFSKMTVGCYQRVILDLALETEKLRRDQDERLRKLEEQILEPASTRMFVKLVVALVSAVTTFCASNGLLLFLKLKDDWIPKFLRYVLSKDTYEGVSVTYDSIRVLSNDTYEGLLHVYDFVQDYSIKANNIFRMVLDQFQRVIDILARTLESNEWAKRETYKEFLSAWSAYYDGGMVVVVTVITLLTCKMLMLCSSFRRRKKRKITARTTSKDPPAQQSENMFAQIEDRYHAPASSKKGKKKPRRKRKDKASRLPANTVTVTEDIPPNPSDESIPELQDESHRESSTVSTIGMSDGSCRHIPSVVSLEE